MTVLRLPFAVLRTAVRVPFLLPRLPAILRENEQLRHELTSRQLELTALQETVRQAADAEVLRAAHGNQRGIIASIVGRSLIPTQHTALLDRGAHDGLTTDSVVLDQAGVVGRVVDIQPATSTVLLLTDPECRVAAVVERSRETGLLVGQAHGLCKLVYLDVHADIQEGDRIVTAGLGGSFPKGLTLGTVRQVIRDEASSAAWAWVEPTAALRRLDNVLVVPASSWPSS